MTLIRTDPRRAGPTALGILIPHGTKTIVILRPRSLEWDLLAARWDGDRAQPPQFCTFERDQAAIVARQLIATLERAIMERVCPVETFGDPASQRLEIWLRGGDLVWIVCRRAPGQAYQPVLFNSHEEAVRAGEQLASLVWPAPDVRQEYYFNTQNLR